MHTTSDIFPKGKIIADIFLLTFIEASLMLYNGSLYSEKFLFILFPCITSWLFAGRALGLYGDFRMKPFSVEWVAFLKTMLLYTFIISFIFNQIYSSQVFDRKHLFFHCTLLLILMPIHKLVIRVVTKQMRVREDDKRRVLIVGTGDAGLRFYKDYVKNRDYGLELTGFIDDVNTSSVNGYYLGKTKDICEVISKHELDEIVVTLPSWKESQIRNVVSVGEKEGKRVRIIPNYHDFTDGKMQVERLGELSIITLRSLPLDIRDNRFFKRLFDLFFSIAVIVLVLSWLIPILGLIIKLTSKGPVFFKQERWGLNNKPITCYKFRSMVASSRDVNKEGVYQQARKGDPRITRLGAFLRKSNLDELPQFLNVLWGSMSVVGPRPHPVPLNVASKDNIDNYMMRHWVKPGITGWAQVNGFRGETRESSLMEKRVQHDLWYIENWSFWFDQQIIVQTLVNIVKGDKNAC
jgi:putative colanic acid biosysnthesis UDP-glucose lipid carrier transferase